MPNFTDRLEIRLIERRDIEEARCLHNDDNTLFRLTDIEHVTEAQQERWFDSMSTSSSAKRYVARERETGDLVGVFRLDRIDWKNRNACVGLDVVPSKRGRSYATEIYEYFFGYLFDQCGMHMLYLTTLAANDVAIGLYTKLGFVIEGRHREAVFRGGLFVDLICMSFLAKEYRERHRP
jgi:RimJ/RimL family protein N-acetyltransferase